MPTIIPQPPAMIPATSRLGFTARILARSSPAPSPQLELAQRRIEPAGHLEFARRRRRDDSRHAVVPQA